MASALETPPTDFNEILAVEHGLVFPAFTVVDAFELGCRIRSNILDILPNAPAAVIQISLANGPQTVFRAVTKSSTPSIVPDNDVWVNRKLATVLRWGMSTYAMHYKFGGGDQKDFAGRYMLGEGRDNAGAFAIHGGGFPIRVKGVEGIVGAIIVSGLKHHEDHQVIVEAVQQYIATQGTNSK